MYEYILLNSLDNIYPNSQDKTMSERLADRPRYIPNTTHSTCDIFLWESFQTILSRHINATRFILVWEIRRECCALFRENCTETLSSIAIWKNLDYTISLEVDSNLWEIERITAQTFSNLC